MKEVLYGDFIESYGSDYTIDVSFGRETKLKESEYDLSEYKSFYGSAPNVSEAYEIVTNVTFKGSKGSEDAKLYIYVGKCSGKWCIFNITQDNGIVDEDTGLKNFRKLNSTKQNRHGKDPQRFFCFAIKPIWWDAVFLLNRN